MTPDDSNMWKEIVGYLWAFLLIPLKLIWDKADRAASKDDVRNLYANAELDRKENRRSFDELQKEMHRIHLDLIHRLGSKRD